MTQYLFLGYFGHRTGNTVSGYFITQEDPNTTQYNSSAIYSIYTYTKMMIYSFN